MKYDHVDICEKIYTYLVYKYIINNTDWRLESQIWHIYIYVCIVFHMWRDIYN